MIKLTTKNPLHTIIVLILIYENLVWKMYSIVHVTGELYVKQWLSVQWKLLTLEQDVNWTAQSFICRISQNLHIYERFIFKYLNRFYPLEVGKSKVQFIPVFQEETRLFFFFFLRWQWEIHWDIFPCFETLYFINPHYLIQTYFLSCTMLYCIEITYYD